MSMPALDFTAEAQRAQRTGIGFLGASASLCVLCASAVKDFVDHLGFQ
jgi:hypothetical protein